MSFLEEIFANYQQETVASFERIGARVKFRSLGEHIHQPLAVDISTDRLGEFFDIQVSPKASTHVVDASPTGRHLVMTATSWTRGLGTGRFLCGHDEYHWFVAALPVGAEAKTVAEAKESLKPGRVKRLERRKELGTSNRRNDVYVRQGEWFFIPCRHASIDLQRVVRGGELLREEGSKPHCSDFLYEDGEREYECQRYPKLVFFESEYRHILQTRRKASQWKWRQLPFEPEVYVKGWIRHADHSPMFLDVWHRVEKNAEALAEELPMMRMVYRD